jgi:hypothetical protein
MKIKLIVVVVVGAVLLGFTAFSSRSGHYAPRQESRIDEVLSYARPGGQIAAGMAEYFDALRVNQITGTVSIEAYNAAINAAMGMQSKRSVNSVWKEIGPDNVGGRTRAFLQDRDSPSLMFLGSVSGGLFRSTSRGSSWKPVNDYQENLNVSCITQNTNGIIIYGTGEGSFNVSQSGTPRGTPGFEGAGIFRSTDRGRTFARVNSTTGFGNINSMASEKTGGSRMYVSTPGGIRYSDDGLSWTLGKSGSSKEVKVATNGMIIAESASGIHRSLDRGQSWTNITPPGANISRASIAISPEDPEYLYVMVAEGGSGTLNGVYRTTNASTNANWEQIIKKGTPYFDPFNVSGNGQGIYDNVITVNPKDKNHIIMGGVTLGEWKIGNNPRYIASLNDFGGANPAYVHADKHILEWDMSTTPPTFICGNDGGLFFSSDNLKTFTSKNFGFNVVQFYAVAADYEGNVVGGSQDNGTQYVNKFGNTELSAVEVKGGDGFQSEISTKNNSIIFSETYYGNVTRSRDYGKSQSCIWDRRISKVFNSLTDTAKYCEHNHQANWSAFNTKFRLWEHPSYDSAGARLFLARGGADNSSIGQLWMARNVTDFGKEPEWYLLASAHGASQVWDIEPTRDGNSVFISNNSTIYRIDGLNSATYDKWSTPTAIPPGITMTNLNFASSGRAITSVNLDPNDNNVAMITLGNYNNTNYVHKGVNMLGTPTFSNITGNLPQMPVYDGLISLTNSNLMFLATDLGVYASDDGGSSWTAQTNASNKFPKVATLAIRQYDFPNRSQGAIYAGTHGRGFFENTQYKTSLNPVLAEKRNNISMTAFPNPADNEVNVKITLNDAQDVTLQIMDLSGKTIAVKVVGYLTKGSHNIKIDVAGIQTGTYIVTGKSGTNGIGTLKLVIRH